MTETEWTRYVCGWLRAVIVPYVASRRQPAGFPDRIIWAPQGIFWIEFKGPSTPLGKAQELAMRRLNTFQPYTSLIWRRVGRQTDLLHVEYCHPVDHEVQRVFSDVAITDVLEMCATLRSQHGNE